MATGDEVEILRDGYGIPHCYARSEIDAFFAQGWVHAADRMWQMEYDRRRAAGRWAEIAGGRGVASDLFHRRLDLISAVERDMAALAPETTAMLEAYADGVNARIAEGGLGREFDVAAIEPAAWEPLHSLLVARVRHIMMGSGRHKLWRSVVRRVLGEEVARGIVAGFGEGSIACVPPGAAVEAGGAGSVIGGATGSGDDDGGSNNWVLSGRRTASGLPLLAGDPHRVLEAPNVYVQAHVACPSWDVLGIGMPGVPGFSHFGHNARVAWSITHAMADDQDLFEVDVDSYAVSRTEIIEVRGGDPLDVDIVHTPRGPVIGEGLALCWTATAAVNVGFDALAPMLRAATVEELFEAMRPWVEPVNSLLAADVDGTIGYLTRGRVPRRPRADGTSFPVPGDDPAFAWDGWVPFDEMPRCFDPQAGFLFSANNPISSSARAPYIGADTAPSWRARRIVELLETMTGATVGDMSALQRDVVSLAARRVMAMVAWPALVGWDGSMLATSKPAAAYSLLRRELMAIALERSGLGEVTGTARNRLLPGIVPEGAMWRVVEQHLAAGDESLLAGWSWDEAIAAAKARAEAAWHSEAWGDLHVTRQRHALGDPRFDPDPVTADGDLDTIMVGGYTPTQGFASITGSVARYVFDLADWDRSGWVVPLGSAGDAGAPHGTDQQEAWRTGRLLPAPYSRAAVEAATATATTRSSSTGEGGGPCGSLSAPTSTPG